ncbi:cytochrome P450 [Actinosynnema pretiosum]|uniref:Cytochrome P450 n=1 Tax=Actinosynnema pretiosum TaxID=42197 RepID=A0A290Z660_9PSEU|nr:cytochrome P450 [Actinosynnema pretiosum]ATE54500.1 cytochrome P450 [Actinosynnema pretiosum]
MSARPYPFGPTTGLEVDPETTRLRAERPVSRVRLPFGGEGWLAVGHTEVRTVLGDRRFSRSALLGADVPRTTPRIAQDPTILNIDPPEHSRLRRLVSGAFTTRRVELLRPGATRLAEGLVDALLEAGPPADLVSGLARPLPSRLMCELLGVPFGDRAEFFGWADRVVAASSTPPEEVGRALGELKGYIAGLVAERRRRPTDDLLGFLVQARDERDQLTETELVAFGATLLLAGLETTANQIGNFAYHLLTRPHLLDGLRADPSGLPGAVDELLRYTPIAATAGFTRVATEDVELGGVVVRAGEAVLVDLDSANRDERVFADPDVLDLGRPRNPHLAFGHGPHFCLGAQLARMELEVALGVLLDRVPGLRLAVPAEQAPWNEGKLVRGLARLPVEW